MTTAIEAFKQDNEILVIYQDPDPWNPREKFENLFKFAFFGTDFRSVNDEGLNEEQAQEIQKSRDYISFPVYMYDHSAVAFSMRPFSCPWDSGCVGITYCSKEDIRKNWDWWKITAKRLEKVRRCAELELEAYSCYANGDIFGFVLYRDNEEFDSSWGYFGDDHEESGLFQNAGFKKGCYEEINLDEAFEEELAALQI